MTQVSRSEQSADEFFLSFNGFDEIAVAKAFGTDISNLRKKPFTFLRALAFVHQRREGLDDKAAHTAAQQLTIGDLGEYFAEDLDGDLDQEHPETEGGKGSPLSD